VKPVTGRWKRTAVVLVAAGLAFGVAACGSSSDDDASTDTIVVTDSKGEQTITKNPQRIVSMDNQWLDSLLALDTKPVAYIDNLSVVAGSAPPWEEGKLDGIDKLNLGGDLVEKIGALEPDLILVPNFLIDEPTYQKLKALAPTLTAITTSGVDPWDVRVETLGTILGKEDKADEVIAGVNAKLDGLAAKYPGLQGKTFVTAYLVGTNITVLADPNDGSAKIFAKLGMSIPQNLIDIAGPTGRPAISTERIGELNSDMLIAASQSPNADQFKALPGYDSLRSVQKDAVYIADLTTITALNQPTVLALPYALDKIEPTLANAAK